MKAASDIETDCLINYETVRYCGGQDHERKRYAEAVRKLQAKEYEVTGMCNFCHFPRALVCISVYCIMSADIDRFIFVVLESVRDLGQNLIYVSQFEVLFLPYHMFIAPIASHWTHRFLVHRVAYC